MNLRTKRRTWTERDTWRSAAYRGFRDSREWRYLLAINPTYDIRYHPAPGLKFNTIGPVKPSIKAPSAAGPSGLLKTVGTNLDLRSEQNTDNSQALQASIWPWSSAELYVERLGDYTGSALLNKDRTNGYCIDSPQASGNTQR